ncbi:MAG TPA: FAD-dependent oxidoreductase [Acidimicrobiales bacterium]|nr:FAD-dependent oxidoreductase [Acidimicrobiales bacterium]
MDGVPSNGSVTVVGGGLAGWRAIETLRTDGYEGKITLVGAEQHLPYDRPPLSKQVLAGTWPPEKAVLADRRRSSELQVHEVLGHRAVSLDPEGGSVELDDGTVLGADGIVLATGVGPRPFPGAEALGPADGVFVLRTLDDSLALRRAVTARDGSRVVIIGAGFIGAEVASTCAALGCRVTVLEAMDTPLVPVLGPLLGGYCATLYDAHGITLHTGVSVTSIERSGAGLVVTLAGREALEADVVLVSIGVTLDTGWLERSGLVVDRGVVCDDRLYAGDKVVAAGDIARWNWHHDGEEELIRIEHWQVAAEAGVAAARSLLAGRKAARPFTPIPYFWSDQFGIRFQVLGSPRGDDDVEIVNGSLEEGKFVALFGRTGRFRAVMAIGRPRQLMGYRPLLEQGSSWDDAMALTPG